MKANILSGGGNSGHGCLYFGISYGDIMWMLRRRPMLILRVYEKKSMMKRRKRLGFIVFLLAFMFLSAMAPARKAQAASLGKPKYRMATFTDGKLFLSWTKVRKAKYYQILRSTRKNGGYKVIGRTKNTSVLAAANGNYYYRIRAVRGKKKGKMSAARHIFAVKGRVNGHARLYGRDILRIEITNMTNTPIYFRGLGAGKWDATVYILNSAKQVIWSTYCYVTNENGSYYVSYALIPANSTRNLFISTSGNIPSMYLDDPFMTSVSFFPGSPYTNNFFALGVDAAESAVAGTNR